MVVGRANALAMASSLLFAFVPLSMVPFIGGLTLSTVSGILLGLADLGIFWIAIYIVLSKDGRVLGNARKYSLLWLFVGLLALLAASLGY